MRSRWLLLLCAILASETAWAQSRAEKQKADADSLRKLITRLDAIVTKGQSTGAKGNVIKPDQFSKLQEDADLAEGEFKKISSRIEAPTATSLQTQVTALRALISQKADSDAVTALAKTLRNAVIDAFRVTTAPAQTPNLALATVVYRDNCATCHGSMGRADGPLSTKTLPPATNFHNSPGTATASPFRFYNTLIAGIPKTAMDSYKDALTTDEIWSTSFYLLALRHGDPSELDQSNAEKRWQRLPQTVRSRLTKAGLSLSLLSRMDDTELTQWISESLAPPHQAPATPKQILPILRTSASFLKETPRWGQASSVTP